MDPSRGQEPDDALFHKMKAAMKNRIHNNAMSHPTIVLCCSSDSGCLRVSKPANVNGLSSTPMRLCFLRAARPSPVLLDVGRYPLFEWRLSNWFLMSVISLPPAEPDPCSLHRSGDKCLGAPRRRSGVGGTQRPPGIRKHPDCQFAFVGRRLLQVFHEMMI